MKKNKNSTKTWEDLRQEVISKCPYFVQIEPEIKKVKSLDIPPLLKLFLNEAIGDFVFGMYTSAIILCRTACEMALKDLVIETYISITKKEDINKSVIESILNLGLYDLELILKYNKKTTPIIESTINEVRKLGNIHVHGNTDKIIKKYLENSHTKKFLIEYCLNLKKLDYLMSPEGSLKYMMFDGDAPELDQIKITKEEAEEIIKQFPDALGGKNVMPISKKLLVDTLHLYEEIFGKLLTK
ncbi:MAG: hypothetical protein MUO82_05425 [Candidatus Thermoplasmatota archaeon]|nr:hypothetical protein [Candidatus Thermoplasmatota archaeon]